MNYKVLKPFNYGPDGVTGEWLAKGAVKAIVPELVEGLTDEGYIEETKEKAAPVIDQAALAKLQEDVDATAKASEAATAAAAAAPADKALAKAAETAAKAAKKAADALAAVAG